MIYNEQNRIKSYEGEWKNNYYNGKGMRVNRDDRVYIGNFENGLRSGQGQYDCEDGSTYRGEFKNDFPN